MPLHGIRHPSLRVLWRTAVLALALGSAACGDDDDDPVTPSTVTVGAGTTVNATAGSTTGGSGTINITRSNFTGPVTLTFTGGTGFPTTITLPSPVTIAAGQSSGAFTINVPAGVAAGTYPITVTTSGAGLTSQTSTVNLVVAAGQPAQSITVALDSAARRINPGQTVTQNVTITRVGGFTGAVNLAVDTTTLPRGVRATLGSSTLATGVSTTTLTLVADTNAAVSNTAVNVRINATGTGVTAQSATLALTVAQQPGVTFGFIGTNNAATVQTGGTQTFRFLVNRQGGFTGPVTFTPDSASLPRGVSIVSTTFAGDTAIVTLRADSTTAQAGSFTVNLRGSGTGITTRTFALPLTVQPRGTFTAAPRDTAAMMAQAGSTIAIPIRITRTGGFTGNVAFAATGLPTGVTASFDSATATGAADTVRTLRLTIPSGQALGTFPVTVTAVTPGLASQTSTVRVNVNQVATPVLTVNAPTTVAVAAGASGTTQISINRQGSFTGTPLTVSGFTIGGPAGFTVTGPTGPVTGDSTTVTIAANSSVAPGIYTVPVRISGAGGVERTANVQVVVAPTSGALLAVNPNRITVQQGGTATGNVIIARAASFTGGVTLGVSGAPQGLTVRVDTGAVAGTNATLTVTAASTVAPGTYRLRVFGTAPQTGSTIPAGVPGVEFDVVVVAGTSTAAARASLLRR